MSASAHVPQLPTRERKRCISDGHGATAARGMCAAFRVVGAAGGMRRRWGRGDAAGRGAFTPASGLFKVCGLHLKRTALNDRVGGNS